VEKNFSASQNYLRKDACRVPTNVD